MGKKLVLGGGSEKTVKDPGVPEVDFRPFDDPLGEIGVPGPEGSHHESGIEQFDVVPHGHIGDPEGTGQFGIVDDLAVIMTEHGPEPVQGPGRDVDPELGDVPLQKGSHILLQPGKGTPHRFPQERPWGSRPGARAGLSLPRRRA